MFGAEIVADTVAYGAPQIRIALGGKTLIIRGPRAGEAPTPARPIQPYANFSSHNRWHTGVAAHRLDGLRVHTAPAASRSASQHIGHTIVRQACEQ